MAVTVSAQCTIVMVLSSALMEQMNWDVHAILKVYGNVRVMQLNALVLMIYVMVLLLVRQIMTRQYVPSLALRIIRCK